ncbi:hypothetical protein Lalb_Chr16g0378111 [Lupinus albus]|uniref:Uncharacterized protein n=1 Tax=Lupinus albus TaxID=3870 RepID=A0A6A4P564_LUPAL|nr:hypothetical protein Lalb_Chr16g0378111 [Lupinus albus]
MLLDALGTKMTTTRACLRWHQLLQSPYPQLDKGLASLSLRKQVLLLNSCC